MSNPWPANPFIGLRPFERGDSLYYFGRDEQVRALLTNLHRSRFLAVVGSSGCGKSSLVRAGLIPALEAGFLVQERDRWRIAACKPGEAPLVHLAGAVLEAAGLPVDRQAATDLAARLLEEGPEAAIETLAAGADAPQTNCLLLIDQFEELFRFGLDGAGPAARAEAESFVALLLRLADQDRLPVYCAITMRSDFIGDCDAYTGLPEAINRGQFLVPRLTRAQRREAIVGPVRLTGQRIAPRLVDRLLNERFDTRDDLPILQHALQRCWDHWAAAAEGTAAPGPLDDPDYEAIGTIRDTLNRHADQALAELDASNRTLARRLFQALTEVDARNRRIRRPARLSELAAVAGVDPEHLYRVMDPFRTAGRNFLVLSSDPDPLVDISHESLIRQWQTLRDWVDQEALDAKVYRRLADTAARHTVEQPRFYRDADLKEAVDWKWRQRPTAAWAERYSPGFAQAMAFLRDSRLVRNRERRERRLAETERARLLEERAALAEQQAAQERGALKRARRWGLSMAALAFLMLVIAGAAGYFWLESGVATAKAEAATTDAKAQRDRAEAQALAASVNLARAYEEKAVGILNKPEDQRGTTDYQEALLQALQAQRQKVGGTAALRPAALASLHVGALDRAFAQRWAAPSPNLGSTIESVAFSPDGRLLAGASGDKTVHLFDPATGARVRTLEGHQDQVTAVAFSPDGLLLASASRDKTVRLWNPNTGAPVRTLAGHQDTVSAVAFSPDGHLLASASADKTVRLWDAATGATVRTLEGHQGSVTAVAFSPNGRLLASASRDKRVRLWDPASGATVRVLAAHEGFVNAVAFSPDGRVLASGSEDSTVRLQDPATGDTVHTLRLGDPALGATVRALEWYGEGVKAVAYKEGVKAVAFSPDGRLLASAAEDGTVRLWDPATGATVRTLEGYQKAVNTVAFSPDGRLLASAAGDGTMGLWDPATGATVRTLDGHQEGVTAVAFSPDGRLLASAAWDKTVRLWDPATGALVRTLEGHRESVTAVAFSPDGRLLASASADNTVRLWDLVTGATVRTLKGHEESVTAVTFSPDGRLLASGSEDNTVRLWDPATGATVRTLEGHQGSVNAVAFSPDGRLLAIAAGDAMYLRDPETGAAVRPLSQQIVTVVAVAFSPDGRLLASAWGTWVDLQDPATGALIRTLKGPQGRQDTVKAVAFSPNGRLLAVASGDKTVRLWDPASGATVRTLRLWDPARGARARSWDDYRKDVNAVAFSPDGRRLASASSDNTVGLWDLRTWLRTPSLLPTDDAAPSPRAALISEALQRLWGLRVSGLDIVPENWNGLFPRNGYYVDQEVTIDVRPAAATADPKSQPILRTFDIRPLLDPPAPGKDKLDQFLDWLAEQEPRLRP